MTEYNATVMMVDVNKETQRLGALINGHFQTFLVFFPLVKTTSYQIKLFFFKSNETSLFRRQLLKYIDVTMLSERSEPFYSKSLLIVQEHRILLRNYPHGPCGRKSGEMVLLEYKKGTLEQPM